MPDTGERNENTQSVKAKESEIIQESKKLALKTKQLSDNQDLEDLKRRSRTTKWEPLKKGN